VRSLDPLARDAPFVGPASEQEAEELAAEVARRLDALCGADGIITLPTPVVYRRDRARQD
jgi:hypothetical protein